MCGQDGTKAGLEFGVGGEGIGFNLVVDGVWNGGGEERFGCGRCGTHNL